LILICPALGAILSDMDLLTPREAARRLGVSYPTVKQWIYKGSVRTRRTAGGHHRVPQAEIDRLLAVTGGTLPRSRRQPGTLVGLSGRNQLNGIVEEVRLEGLLAQVRLRVGDQTLTAIITRDAVEDLKLTRGDEAVAVIKSTEVMIGRSAPEARKTGKARRP
jgi:molybdopterin-binding protein